MKIEFNKNKYLELLKEEKSLEKEGKLLRDSDKSKADELSSYRRLLDDQNYWEKRKEYIQLLELFISKKITLDQFFPQFFGLESSNGLSSSRSQEKLEEEILLGNSNEIDIQVNPKSYGFAKLISFLFSVVELCDPDVTLEMNLEDPESINYGTSEEYFRLEIEEYFLPKLKKYCEKS